MRTIELVPPIWSEYFAAVTLEDAGSLTQVRAVSGTRPAAVGAPIARPLRQISFDGNRHVIALSVGGTSADRPAVRYFVSDPSRVFAIEAAGLRRILILDTDGLRTLVRLARHPEGRVGRIRSRSHGLGNSTRSAARRRRSACEAQAISRALRPPG
jgi:hypothetical protein